MGQKRVENRHFRMRPGWYALHTGQKLTQLARTNHSARTHSTCTTRTVVTYSLVVLFALVSAPRSGRRRQMAGSPERPLRGLHPYSGGYSRVCDLFTPPPFDTFLIRSTSKDVKYSCMSNVQASTQYIPWYKNTLYDLIRVYTAVKVIPNPYS